MKRRKNLSLSPKAIARGEQIAVADFEAGKITFGMIWRVVDLTIQRHKLQRATSLDDLLEADRWARATAQTIARSL